jgi:hypothetical protein
MEFTNKQMMNAMTFHRTDLIERREAEAGARWRTGGGVGTQDAAQDRHRRLERLRRLAVLLDSSITIPG